MRSFSVACARQRRALCVNPRHTYVARVLRAIHLNFLTRTRARKAVVFLAEKNTYASTTIWHFLNCLRYPSSGIIAHVNSILKDPILLGSRTRDASDTRDELGRSNPSILPRVKDSPGVDYKRRFSKERESVSIWFGTCLPNKHFIISIRHWQESRPSGRISGLLSCRHFLIGH